MMAHKHLHELLEEDQEPFLLMDYIADRRCQLKSRPIPKTTLQVKKRRPIVETSTSKRSLCKQACFFSFHDSPDLRKSPFLDFPSPAKSPCKSPNAVFLHIPAKTAGLLLEAAMRIQKQSSSKKPKSQIKNVGFGLFGSIMKRLSNRSRTQKREIQGDEVGVPVKDFYSGGRKKSTGKSEKVYQYAVGEDDKSAFEMGLSCSSLNKSRRNSTGWSESNEDKSLDLETSSSCRSDESEEREFVYKEIENGDFASYEKRFYSSPFRFALQNSPSPFSRTPDFTSPAASPCRHKKEVKEYYEAESNQKIQLEEVEKEKEQCSPVSVLDPPFEDDDEGIDGGDEEDDYDMECSYAIVQRTKQQLFQKLRRFEKLAELDPIELEKAMLEEQDDEDDNEDLDVLEDFENAESASLCREQYVDGFITRVVCESGLCPGKVSADMKRLVSDLVAEERREQNSSDDGEVVVKSVCRRLDSWKDVESNTIDMMVELDFRRELDGWNKNQEQVRETAMEIELAIFGLLVEELSEELVCLPGLQREN